MSILDHIVKPISNYLSELGTIHYEKPKVEPKYKPEDVPGFVPEQYRSTILENANYFDFDPKKVAALINTENTPWDPSLPATDKSSTSIGLGQHNDNYYKQYNPVFQKLYGGRSYDRTNPEDAIAATFIGLDDLRKRSETKSEDDAIKAYHVGFKGLFNLDDKYNEAKKNAEKYYKAVMSHLQPKEDSMVK